MTDREKRYWTVYLYLFVTAAVCFGAAALYGRFGGGGLGTAWLLMGSTLAAQVLAAVGIIRGLTRTPASGPAGVLIRILGALFLVPACWIFFLLSCAACSDF